MATSLSLEEQETIFLYNQKDKTCFVGTHDRSLINKLNKLSEEDSSVVKIKEKDGYAEFQFPKKYIKVRPPRKMSDEQKESARERMLAIHAAKES